MDDGPWLYNKLTNEPKDSGELKKLRTPKFCPKTVFLGLVNYNPATWLLNGTNMVYYSLSNVTISDTLRMIVIRNQTDIL